MREVGGCLVIIAGLALTGCCFSSCFTSRPPGPPAPGLPQPVAQQAPPEPEPPAPPEPAPRPEAAPAVTPVAVAPAVAPPPVPAAPKPQTFAEAVKRPDLDVYEFIVGRYGKPGEVKKTERKAAGDSRWWLYYFPQNVLIVLKDAKVPPARKDLDEWWVYHGAFEASIARPIAPEEVDRRFKVAEDARREAAQRKAAQEAAERAERQPTGVTYKSYQRIKDGDSYERVREIIGQGGAEVSRNSIAGITTVLMEWKAGFAVLHVYFQNGAVTMKAQFGLR